MLLCVPVFSVVTVFKMKLWLSIQIEANRNLFCRMQTIISCYE